MKVKITPEIRKAIEKEIERTGFGPQRALKGNVLAKRIGLTSGIIYGMIGKNGMIQTAKKAHIDVTLRLWEDIPDKIKE